MLSQFSRLMAAMALSLGLSAANAALVSHDFTVQWDDGLDAGTTSQGSFSFNDVALASPFTWDQLTSFDFDFRGVSIGLSDVGAENKPYIENQIQSLLTGAPASPLTFTFHQSETYSYYTVSAGTPTSFDLPYSSGTWQLASPVPEPGAVAMMLGGLALVGGVAARRRKTQG
jgi:hypothetical protein